MPKSVFDDVLKDIRAALIDEALTPESRVRALLDQIEQIHNSARTGRGLSQ